MRPLYPIGVFIGGVLVHWWWATYFSVFGLAPQVLLVLTVAVASCAGPAVSQTLAFAWGLVLDVLGVHLFGGNALALTLTAYLVNLVRRQMDVSDPISQGMFTGIVSLAYFLFMALLGLAFRGESFWVGWKVFCLIPLVNGLAAPVGFAIVRRYTRT